MRIALIDADGHNFPKGELFSHEATQVLGGGTRYMVVCSRCFGRAGNADTRDGAIKMWNRRSGYETN